MNADLKEILDAMAYVIDEDGNVDAEEHQDIDKARQLSTAYVNAHPEEFVDFAEWGTDEAARERTVQAVDTFRSTGMLEMWARAEAWHFFSWAPVTVGGQVQPQILNVLPGGTS